MAACAWKFCPRRAASCVAAPGPERRTMDVFADARLTNCLANALALLAVLAMVIGALAWAVRRPYFAISRIEIAPMAAPGLQYVTPLSLRTALAGRIQGNFFLMDLDEA